MKRVYFNYYTNYINFTPFEYKIGLFKTLFHRYYKLNYTEKDF